MKEKFLLDASMYYYSEKGEPTLLKNSCLESYNYVELKMIFDSISTDIFHGEYEPNKECIKCSIILTSLDDDKYEKCMLEKYFIIYLNQLIDNDFVRVFNSLNVYPI